MLQDHTFTGSDGDFHYIKWGGSGPMAHISHATGFCAGLYTPFAERLKAHLQVLAMDDRGHGKTRAPANPRHLNNWDIFAEDLERFFEHLDEPVIAMGHSRGAVSSLVLAVKRPELVRALVLIDPTIYPLLWKWPLTLGKKFGLLRFTPIAARAARRKRIWPDTETILSAYGRKLPFRAWEDGFLEAYIAHGSEGTGQGAVRLCCEPAWESRCFAMVSPSIWHYVAMLRHPTLVIHGAKSDTFLPQAVKRFKAMVPSATFRCFEATSHFVPMERPGETTEAVLTFLRDEKII
jgi:pimeloyl-ACP methyl ester carboxylesterase